MRFRIHIQIRRLLAAHIPVGQAIVGSEQTLETFVGECVDMSQIPSKFEYVALGHIHRFQQIKYTNMQIYYTGSSEMCEFNEEHDVKYAALVELGISAKVTPIKLQTRKMITVVNQDCSGLSASKITEGVLAAIDEQKEQIAEAIVRIKLENINIDENRHIEWDKIKTRLCEYGVFDFKFQPRTILSLPELDKLAGDYMLPPSKELELYVKGKKEYQGKAKLLLKLGNELIKEAEEGELSEA